MAVERNSDDTWKIAVIAASTTDIPTNSVLPAVDGLQTVPGNRILLKNQNDPFENGIYIVQSFTLVKDTDNNVAWSFVNGAIVRVLGGMTNLNTEWYIAPIAAVDYSTTAKIFVTSPFTSSGGGGAAGSGTLNYISKFTPDGMTLGDSQIFDDGVNVGIGTATPLRKFHQSGGKFLVESSDGSYGQFQVVNTTAGEVTFVLAAEATVNYFGTLSSTNSGYIWAYGLGSYGYASDNFIIGNNYVGGDVARFTYDSKVYLRGLMGTGDRMVEADTNGQISASRTIISTYGVPNTEKLKLENSSNWDANGVYTGAAITGTYQGQKHYDDNFLYEAVSDNSFIRLIRG